MKIGILTFHYSNNYGAVLQTFALKKVLERLGHQPTIINRVPNSTDKVPIQNYVKKIVRNVVQNYLNKTFIQFRKEYLQPMTKVLDKEVQLTEIANMFDAVIVGSDQVWRMSFTNGLGFNNFLDFVPDQILKIAYAASFGTNYFEGDKQVISKVKILLSKFNAISVREETGKLICLNTFKTNAIQTLDPTLLLPPKEYEEIFWLDKDKRNNKYVAYYFLDITDDKRLLVKKISNYYNIEFRNIFLEGEREFTFKKISFPISKFKYPSVASWINGLKKAKFVVTDSFHGVAFSILFNKQFICIGNHQRGMSRMQDLLKIFNLEDRLITNLDIRFNNENFPNIDYTESNKILKNERHRSIGFLVKNLN